MKRRSLFVFGTTLLIAGMIYFFGRQSVFAALTELSSDDAFDGWAWSGAPADQGAAVEGSQGTSAVSPLGFLHLNCASNGSCASEFGNYPKLFVDVDPESPTAGEVNGWAWVGSAQADVSGEESSIGWLNFDPQPSVAFGECGYPTEPCVDARVDAENGEELYGWARFETLAEYGRTTVGQDDWGWVSLRGGIQGDPAYEYGVLYRDGRLEGWAYAGGGTLPGNSYSNAVGFGWLDFSQSSVGSDPATGPATGYFSTAQGDVYASQGISNPSGTLSPAQYNATFLLVGNAEGGFSAFTSEEQGETFTDDTYIPYYAPTAENNYQSALGSIDFEKLTTVLDGTNVNVYGDIVERYTTVSQWLAAEGSDDIFLDGRIIVITGAPGPLSSHVLPNSLTFRNGTSSQPRSGAYDGSGTILVQGNLTIQNNVFYNKTALTHTRNLASVAWIVQGDLTITAQVSNLVGAFFVLGNNEGSAGRMITQPASFSQLVVYGLAMAKGFTFQRNYQGLYGEDEPAELIYYDGRIVTNTPPGLRDVSSTLPFIVQGNE